MKKFSKREFITTSFGGLAFFCLNQVKASTILDSLAKEVPGPIELELINNSKKQILLAEAEPCGVIPCTPMEYKTKCQSSGLCGPSAK